MDPWPDADGFAVIHHRAWSPTCYFGPFATLEEAILWVGENGVGHIVPLYRTIDWSR